jgi:EAL domain-containing protein (putative c-di-GMP-specific phosphodiesterase class I)
MQVLSKAPKDVKVAVNLSAVSLMRPGFPEALIKIAASTPTLRARMLLELTETHALEDLEKANRILQDLRALGHLISMDDFGAGAASLEYLRNLDVDFVKIDGRYVQSLTRGSRDEAILKHVVALCRQIGVNAIAEMVETTEVAELVADLGVSLGQGWLFGRATAELNYAPPPPIPARRTGERETWS